MTSPCHSNDYAVDGDAVWAGRWMGSGCNDTTATTITEEDTADVLLEKQELYEEDTAPEYDTGDIDVDTFISCDNTKDHLTDDTNINRIDLKYDYEIHTTKDTNLDFSVHVFELDLVKAIAEKYGLANCSKFSSRRSLVRKLTTTSVVGVDSSPADVTDIVHTECIDEALTASSSCTPMNGKITAWISKPSVLSESSVTERGIYSTIEEYSNSYTNYGGVLAISYIGTPETEIVKQEASKNDISEGAALSSHSMPPAAIVGIAIASVVFALLTILALVAKKKRKEKITEKNRARNIVNNALFMIDDDDNVVVEMSSTKDDTSVVTEDYTYDGGFEIKL